ncbi:MAG TPA: histidine kinase [Ideonella sp.]|nr:histidine kinase [Ideonella sp.]
MKVAPTPAHAAKSVFSELSLRRLVVAVGLAVLAAVVLNPIFSTPFVIVLARLLVISLVLLLVFTMAGAWQPPGIPRWLTQSVAVVLAVPLATFVVYLPSVGGDVWALLAHDGLVTGFFTITSTVLLIAPLLAFGALYRERDAQARSQSLLFELERSQLEKQALDAQLRLLHAQIEPHFLFNTLANVQELVESGSSQAGPVLKSLIAYLRAAMPRLDDEGATLGNEASLVRAYLALMHMRMPDRLSFEVDIPAAFAAERFPSMALLTLVENAIHHGIDPSEQGGRIDVRAQLDPASGELVISVADTGTGMSETAAPGTGLANLRARLAAFYDPPGRLELMEQRPHGVRAEIHFTPAPRQQAAQPAGPSSPNGSQGARP